MPLHGEHEVTRVCSFHCLNDAIVRAARNHPQPLSNCIRRLMMR